MTRRTFLKTGLTLGLGITAKALGIMPAQAKESGRMFQVTKTDEEWREILTPEKVRVRGPERTKPAFSHKYAAKKDPGPYPRTRSDLHLRAPDPNYDSRTGPTRRPLPIS